MAYCCGLQQSFSLRMAAHWGLARFRATTLPHIKEGNEDCDVVDHALLTRPTLHRLFHQEVDCAIRIFILVIVVGNDGRNFLIRESVKETI